jgi:hypothetical protein
MELVVVVVAFTLLAGGLVFAFDAWARQQQLKLMRASNSRLLKR